MTGVQTCALPIFLVEFDGAGMAQAVLGVAHAALAEAGPVQAVGISTQRASTIVWDRATGEPVGPGLGWQDLRTVIDCIVAKSEHGLGLAPNQSATKVAWLLNQFDPSRERDACGIGFVAHIKGEKSRGVVEEGLQVLARMAHRAATGADPLTGDGAGILVQVSHRFFKREGLALGFEIGRAHV